MASVRLTMSIKEQIERRLIRYRFAEEAQQLVADYAQLASDVYDDLYPEITRKKMEAMPKGWLPRVASVGAQFGESSSRYIQLSFDGKCYGEIAKAGGRDKEADYDSPRPVPYSDKDGCLKCYGVSDPLSERYSSLEERWTALEANIRAARRAAKSAMDQVTTLNRLIEVWPEIAPFTEGFANKTSLPAIPRSDLNGLLGLPKEDVA